MSDDFEKQLKNALRSVDPAEGFADRVMGRIEREPQRLRGQIFRWLREFLLGTQGMNTLAMKSINSFICALTAVALLLLGAAATAADAQLKLPNFDALADKASESVTITLDPALLGIAARFLDPASFDGPCLSGTYIRRMSG